MTHFSAQVVKDVAKQLFVEVIDEMAQQTVRHLLDAVRRVTAETRRVIDDVIEDATRELLT